MSELNKQETKWIKENWEEIIRILYNNVNEKDLFEVLLMDYEPCKGFLEVLQEVILANENWFTSNITFETKVALLKEITNNSSGLCEYCGSVEPILQEIKESQKVIITCKACGNKIKEINIQSPEF